MVRRFTPGDRVFLRPALVGSEKQGTIESDDGAKVVVLVDGSRKPKPFKRARVRLQPDFRTTTAIGPFRTPARPAIPPPPNPIVDDEPRRPIPGEVTAAIALPDSNEFRAPTLGRNAIRPPAIEAPRVPGLSDASPPRRLVPESEAPRVAQLRPVPKPPLPERDARYLAFIREHACCSCGSSASVEAHHWARRGQKGLGTKPSDYQTVPLCQRCHDHFHTTGELPQQNAPSSRVWFLAKQVDLLIEWVGEIAAPRRARRART